MFSFCLVFLPSGIARILFQDLLCTAYITYGYFCQDLLRLGKKNPDRLRPGRKVGAL